ncbi:MAG TPA: glycosyl hydrolase, partial [Planctomycetia bacterium]|nr:glycosyl hydrolase [Planctomycetia bacterium]
PPSFARGLVDAVGRSEGPAVGIALLKKLPSLTPDLRQAAQSALLARADWTELLLAAAEGGKFALEELTLDQKQALAQHPRRPLAERARKLLAKGGGLPNADRQKVVEQYLASAKRTGNATTGKLIYKNQCGKCHVHGTEGTRIGPDLTGMAVHPKEELLIHILDPSRSVEGNFRQYLVATEDGRTLSGLLASENRTALEFFDAEGKKQVVLRDDVARLVASPKSLMPDGFEKQVTIDDMANLLEFLTQRGKYLPLPLGKAATIVSTKGMFYRSEDSAERLIFPDWTPKTFAGVPFQLVDPQGDRFPNVILLYGPEGTMPPKMPRSVKAPCNAPAKAIHILGGVSGWGFPLGQRGSVSMTVRLRYKDGATEDHPLKNGEHLADYIRRVDVPGSKFAFDLGGRQLRYLSIAPKRSEVISEIEFIKGRDRTAPVVVAVTVEAP